jgi:hypothetical protein
MYEVTHMTNVQTKVQGDKLIITVDVSEALLKAAPPSKTGKSRIVASTSGFTAVGNVKLNLTAIA